MDERDAFLHILAADEDDVTTRLVYADSLDDHGEHDESAHRGHGRQRRRGWWHSPSGSRPKKGRTTTV